jgi:hypothetical protein
VILLRRVPLPRLLGALGEADPARFLAFMVPNALFYFCWDTLVLTAVIRTFHGPVAYRDLLAVRAASYVFAAFNTHLGRGALAACLARRLRAPLLELAGTVAFLLLTEYVHLAAWTVTGLTLVDAPPLRPLRWVAPAVAALWLIGFGYFRLGLRPSRGTRWLLAPREWTLLRTLKRARATDYARIALLRAPMFLFAALMHAGAARAFGMDLPLGVLVAGLPVIFMLAALPVSFAHLGTTQAAWVLLFGAYAAPERLLAFSLSAHLTFVLCRAVLGTAFLPRAWSELAGARPLVMPR